MNRRILILLFVCSLVPWWIGAGLMPLLPLYAAQLGATPGLVGSYLSLIFVALAVGTVMGGRLAGAVRRQRELLALVAAAGLPTTLLMGQVTHVWQLIVLNAGLWFVHGLVLALVVATTGRATAERARGRVFGLLAMTGPLGGLLGAPMGAIADHWGYGMLFALAASLWPVAVVAALALPVVATGSASRPAQTTAPAARLGGAFWQLMAAGLLYSTGGFAVALGQSLAMSGQGFAAATISVVAALGSAVGLFVLPLAGRLADRVDRRTLLAGTYLVGAAALVGAAMAGSFPGFVLVSVLMAVSGADRAVAAALAGDLVPAAGLGRGLSLLDAAKWIGGVVGLSGTGYLIAAWGLRPALLICAGLPLLAAGLLLSARRKPAAAPHAPSWQVHPVEATAEAASR